MIQIKNRASRSEDDRRSPGNFQNQYFVGLRGISAWVVLITRTESCWVSLLQRTTRETVTLTPEIRSREPQSLDPKPRQTSTIFCEIFHNVLFHSKPFLGSHLRVSPREPWHVFKEQISLSTVTFVRSDRKATVFCKNVAAPTRERPHSN